MRLEGSLRIEDFDFYPRGAVDAEEIVNGLNGESGWIDFVPVGEY
jgi:hypothetical protein